MTKPTPTPIATGLKCRCPHCGKGRLFFSYLKVARRCESCGLDLEFADSGDGPAIFVIFIVGFMIMAMAMVVDGLFHPPVFVHLALWLPMTIVLSIALLPPLKGVMIALQYAHDAKEGRID